MFNPDIYKNRRDKLRKLMTSGIVLFLGNNETPMNYPANGYRFRQDSNFLYFFGLSHDKLAALIDIDAGIDYIFGNDADMDDIIWMGPQPSTQERGLKTGVHQTFPYAKLDAILKEVIAKGRKIHFAPPYRADTLIELEQLLGIRHTQAKNYASQELIDAIVKLRSVKEPCEIVEIERMVDVAYLMHTTAMKMAKPGIVEREIAGAIEGIALAHGGTVSFPVILSINGQTLHNHYHGNQLVEGRMMVTDAGAESELCYASDITRTVPVGGKFDQRQKEIYQIVLNANLEATKATKPGVTYKSVHLLAARVIASGLKELGLMKGDIDEAIAQGAHALFFPHGLGHQMGLDVHDMESLGENNVGYDSETKRSTQFGLAFLRMGRRLESGFVMTNEPGLYFIPALIDQWKTENKLADFINYDKVETYKDFGGIRIEDDLLITENGCRVLGKPIPKTIAEIEDIMK